jgi:hypothetical protein
MAKDCGHKVPCGCKDTPLTTPAPCGDGIDCPDSTPCAETFDAACIYYTGEDILCGETTLVTTNTTVADAIEAIVTAFCDQTEIDADILCGDDVVVAAGRQVENAIADVVQYFCTAINNIREFASVQYAVVNTPDPAEPLCTDSQHTITYLDDTAQTIATTVFNTRTCEPRQLCNLPLSDLNPESDVFVGCRNGNIINIAFSDLQDLIDAAANANGLFAQTADASVTNTLVSTSLVGSGVGTTSIAANAIEVGSTYEVKMRGTINVGTPVNLTIKLIVDGINVDQVGPLSMPNIGGGGFGTKYFEIDGIFTCRTDGALGGIMSSLTFAYEENASDKFDSHTSDIFAPIDTTVINTVDIEAEWTNADPSNSLTSQIFTLIKKY